MYMIRRDLLKVGAAGLSTLVLSRTTEAMQSIFKKSEKREWAVVFGSRCGSTRQIAEWINEGMGDIADVVNAEDNPSIDDYNYFVIGGWINGGIVTGEVKSFVMTNNSALQDKIMGLFTVCGNGGKPVGESQIEEYLTDQIVYDARLDREVPAKLFNGKSDPACNGLMFTYDLLDENGSVEFGKSIINTTANIIQQQGRPRRFEFFLINPKLSDPVATIRYSLPQTENVLLTVSALNGRKIDTLISKRQGTGNYSINWNSKSVPPGYYLIQLKAGDFSAIRKARVLR